VALLGKDVLTDIVERYENQTHPMPEVSDAAMLRHLIDASGVTQSKLSADVGISMSEISEVLHGKQELNRKQITSLAQHFRVDPGVFLSRPANTSQRSLMPDRQTNPDYRRWESSPHGVTPRGF
jgi:antitoxin component HigA of HigAB toxin-antitoxin module